MLKCLKEYDLKYCGDSVEWCPVDGYKHIFMCGSYQLEPNTSRRMGRIDLFSYMDEELTLIQEIEFDAGLLDAKWAPNIRHDILLAAALSDGKLNIYQFANNKLRLSSSTQVCRNGMALALDWSTGVYPQSSPQIVVSQSDGSISLAQINDDGSLNVLSTFKAHDFEAWTCAFNYWDTNIIFTGGDDCKLNVYDIRKSPLKPVFTDFSHSVGVTCIQCNQKYNGFLATGSYENIKIWKITTGLELVDQEVMNGGTWRVKWNVAGGCNRIAVAGMHDGFSLIDYKVDTQSEMEYGFLQYDQHDKCVKNKYIYKDPHNSLGYGIDWSHENNTLLAACSFYDKKLSVLQLES